jgi:hypothetical protein
MAGFNRRSATWVVILFCVAIVAFASDARPEQAGVQTASVFEGTWEGTFTQVPVPGLREKRYPPQTWRLVVRGNTASMFIRGNDGKFPEVKRGVFKIAQHLTNALVYSIDSGRDRDGLWIETESWLLIQKAPDTLGVLFAGAVKNPGTSDPEILNFFTVRTGEFSRVQ